MKTFLIAFLLMFVACRADEQHASSTEAAHPVVARVTASQDSATSVHGLTSEPATPRMIVRSAELRVVVADTSRAVTDATRSVEAIGGYVAGSQVWREGELLRARLTLRVPSNKLSPALAQLRALAKRVENETMTTDDVSEEFVDLGARLRNLEATEEELRQLLVVARQNSRKAADVLEVHQQLTRIRGEIEQVQGRMRYLTQVTAMSAIAMEMTPDALAKPVVEPGWQPLVVAKDALRSLLRASQVLANAAIWFVIWGVPLALMLFMTWRVVRRRVAVSS